MDGAITPVPVYQSGTTTNATVVTLQMQPPPLGQTVCNAAALGWALTELLGRCFTLPAAQPHPIDFTSGELIMLPDLTSPREQLRALMQHIVFLADSLSVSSCIIEREGDPDENKRYVDVVKEHVILLSKSQLDPAVDGTPQQICGKINQRLFFWDLKIHDILQNMPAVVDKAYMAGNGLAALRWYFGLQKQILNDAFLTKLCSDNLPALSPYLPPFTSGALIYSTQLWGNAIIQGKVQPPQDGSVPPQLQKQADIWHSLVTGEHNPLSSVDPTREGRRYVGRVLRVFLPYLIVGIIVLVVIVAILLIVLFSHLNLNPMVINVTAILGLLGLIGTYHVLIESIGGILQKAVSQAAGDIKGTFIDSLWHSEQQKAVNEALYVQPTGVQNIPTTK